MSKENDDLPWLFVGIGTCFIGLLCVDVLTRTWADMWVSFRFFLIAGAVLSFVITIGSIHECWQQIRASRGGE